MIVICKFNKGTDFPLKARRHETDETKFSPLKVGCKYTVYGLMILSFRVDFLVCPEEASPMWMPSNLFEILDARIPTWNICLASSNPEFLNLFEYFNINCIIGYELLTNSYSHYSGIIDGNIDDMVDFYKQKILIDEWQRKLDFVID